MFKVPSWFNRARSHRSGTSNIGRLGSTGVGSMPRLDGDGLSNLYGSHFAQLADRETLLAIACI